MDIIQDTENFIAAAKKFGNKKIITLPIIDASVVEVENLAKYYGVPLSKPEPETPFYWCLAVKHNVVIIAQSKEFI